MWYGRPQAFAIVLKGKVRPGRSRSDPADGSRCAYDTRVKLGAVLGPEAAAYVLSTRNPPGAVARALSRCLNRAAQSAEGSIPLFAAQRCEEIIRGAAPCLLCALISHPFQKRLCIPLFAAQRCEEIIRGAGRLLAVMRSSKGLQDWEPPSSSTFWVIGAGM